MTSDSTALSFIKPERYPTYDYTLESQKEKVVMVSIVTKCKEEDLILNLDIDNNRVYFAFKDTDMLPFLSGKFTEKAISGEINKVYENGELAGINLRLEFEKDIHVLINEPFDERYFYDPKSAFIIADYSKLVLEHHTDQQSQEAKDIYTFLVSCLNYAIAVRYPDAIMYSYFTHISLGLHDKASQLLDMVLEYNHPIAFFYKAVQCSNDKDYKSAEKYFIKSLEHGCVKGMLDLPKFIVPSKILLVMN